MRSELLKVLRRAFRGIAYDDNLVWISRTIHDLKLRTADYLVRINIRRAVGAGKLFSSVMRAELVLVNCFGILVHDAAPCACSSANAGVVMHHWY